MPEIKGDFTFYASQDDIFSIDLVEKMVQKQLETKAEMVLPDMEYYYENGSNNKKTIGFNGDRNVVLTGKEACLASLNWSIHGFALIKTSLLIQEFFPEDAFDSDDFITRKLFFKSNKVVFCEGIFYYRQDNPEAITKTFSKKNFYALNSVLRLYCLLKENNFDTNDILNLKFNLLLNYLKLKAFFQFYDFDSPTEKKEVAQFLFDFRQKYLNQSFCRANKKDAIKNLKVRYLLLFFVFEHDILFTILTKLYSKKLQKTMKINP